MGLFDFAAKHIGLPSAVKRLGNKIAHSKALRIGEKIAGGVKKIGHKVGQVGHAISHGASAVGKVTSIAARVTGGIPIVGTVAGLVDKGAMAAKGIGAGLEGLGGAAERVGGAAQGIIRVGRSMGEMKTGGDLISTMRDMSRASSKMGGATSNLVSQARSIGSNLQRRK